MRNIYQSTSVNCMVFMTSSTDHVSGVAGATLTITLSKNGGAFASISPTVTDRGSGWYNVALSGGNTDTFGDLALHITASGCDPTDTLYQVVAFDPTNGDNLGLVNLDELISSRVAPTDLIETGLTVLQAFRLIAASVAGKLSGAATTTITIRNAVADTKNRITATVDADGNRTAITYDVT
jgi:hypothetical protein